MNLAELAARRRTHKAFGAEPVPRDTLLELLDVARLAPNHHLTQPWRFRVLGPAALARLEARADARRRDRRALRRAPAGRRGRLRDRGGDHARPARRDRAGARVVLALAGDPAHRARAERARHPLGRARARPAPLRRARARAGAARARAGRALRPIPRLRRRIARMAIQTNTRELVPFRVRTSDGRTVELAYSSPRAAATHDERELLETLPWFEPGKPLRNYMLHETDFYDEVEQIWGRPWGAEGIGTLREVLVSRPTENEIRPEYAEEWQYYYSSASGNA